MWEYNQQDPTSILVFQLCQLPYLFHLGGNWKGGDLSSWSVRIICFMVAFTVQGGTPTSYKWSDIVTPYKWPKINMGFPGLKISPRKSVVFFWTSTYNGSFLGPPCMNLDIKFPFPHRFSTVWKHHRILVTHATSWVAACASAAARRATVRTVPMASFACEAASAASLGVEGWLWVFSGWGFYAFFYMGLKIP